MPWTDEQLSAEVLAMGKRLQEADRAFVIIGFGEQKTIRSIKGPRRSLHDAMVEIADEILMEPPPKRLEGEAPVEPPPL